jgi:hypothetical protein
MTSLSFRFTRSSAARLPRLGAHHGNLLTSGYIGHPRRAISRAALPVEFNRVGTIFLGLIGLGFVSTMIGVSVCLSPQLCCDILRITLADMNFILLSLSGPRKFARI